MFCYTIPFWDFIYIFQKIIINHKNHFISSWYFQKNIKSGDVMRYEKTWHVLDLNKSRNNLYKGIKQ